MTTSPLQRLGADQRNFRRMLPLYPAAASRLPVPACDALISSSSAFAHGARAPAGAVHLCYCHSPFRYVWHEHERALAETPAALRGPMRGVLAMIRRWDLAASRAGGPLRGQLAAHARAHQELLRPRGGGRAPAGGDDPLRARGAGDELLLVSEIVAHKRVGGRAGGGPPGARADRRGGVRPRPRGPRRRLSGGPLPRARGRRGAGAACTRARGRCWCRRWRSSGSPPWRPRPRGGR